MTELHACLFGASRASALKPVAFVRDELAPYDRRPIDDRDDEPERLEAIDAGALLGALQAPVVHVLVAERAPAYLEILCAMLHLRRAHELEPLVDDLARAVPGAQRDRAGREAFARDLAQLEAWGCLERRVEPLQIRGYKDVRRERFRHRLTDDAVALLEWLEVRVAERRRGRARDGRDLLTDLLGQARELTRLTDRWQRGDRDEGDARRALHLLAAIDDGVCTITDELISFRAEMMAFASRAYDASALRSILAWLDRYVRVYLRGVHELREGIVEALGAMREEAAREALSQCRAHMMSELAAMPPALRSGGALRDPGEQLDAAWSFFTGEARLAELCERIESSAREVLRKMHRHLRALGWRSTRLDDLRAAIRAVRGRPEEPASEALATLSNEIVGSAHGRFWPGGPEGRRPPPLPRRHVATGSVRTPSALRPKERTPETARALRAKRLAELATWIDEHVFAGADEAKLSRLGLVDREAARRWADVARARHLGRGRELVALGVVISDAPGVGRLGDDAQGLEAPDCVLARRSGR